MKKITISYIIDDKHDEEQVYDCLNGSKYKLIIDELYNDVLRPVVKYGTLDGWDKELKTSEAQVLSQLIENIVRYIEENKE